MKKILKWTAIGLVIAIVLGVIGVLGYTYGAEIWTDVTNALNPPKTETTTTQTTTALTTDTYYKLGEYKIIDVDVDGHELLEYELNITEDKLDYLNKGYILNIYDADKTELIGSDMKYLSANDLTGEDLNAYVYELDFGFLAYHLELNEDASEFVESDKVSLWVYAELIGGVENAEMFNGFEIKEIVEEDPLPSPAPDTEE